MISLKKYFLFVVLAIIVSSCKKDVPPQRPLSSGTINTGKRLIICNEGDLNTNKATITLFDPLSSNVVQDAYTPLNSNQYIGDILQSAYKFNEKYFWVVNNSGKIVITDKDIHKLISISGFISPRYMVFVSNNKAYVSNLKLGSGLNNYIQVLDLNTNTISKSIRLDGFTEQMAQSYGKVYICNQSRKYVYVISAATDVLIDSIFVNATNSFIVKDQDEKLWVSCNADATNNIPARLVKINPVKDSVETDISLQTTQSSISRLCINGSGNTLYYIMNDLYKMNTTASSPSSSFIQQGNRTFYGLCIDPADETIYISDAIDYLQDGTILRYQANGNYVGSFKAGVVPGFMWIDE